MEKKRIRIYWMNWFEDRYTAIFANVDTAFIEFHFHHLHGTLRTDEITGESHLCIWDRDPQKGSFMIKEGMENYKHRVFTR